MHIQVRNYIRVLGLLLTLLGYFSVYLAISTPGELDYSDIFWLIFSTFFFLPLILASSILGRVPYFIANRIPKIFEDTTLNAEKNFKEFSLESVVGAIVFLTIVFMTIYFQ